MLGDNNAEAGQNAERHSGHVLLVAHHPAAQLLA
jgi:hypothetical protein